jgi:GDP/UDP-N,N'-diacetylbacillosamine 2-epimerase (hydrolysing)
MKIGVLTSSRADYGIYLLLLDEIKKDDFFALEIIAFGTHLSKSHGYTLDNIVKDGYAKIHEISSLISNDNEQAISTSYGLTGLKFADFWEQNKYDLVVCLGDRFEMSAAVQAGIPYGVKFAHFYGGDTTLGAIDNIYRHQITLASLLHFTGTDEAKEKVISLIGQSENVYDVGSLSLDSVLSFEKIDKNTFYSTFNIPDEDYTLITFHPETVSLGDNYMFAKAMRNALNKISDTLFLVITMPNADTLGSIFREEIALLKEENPERVLLIENFGKTNYFNAMHYSKVLIGNTSSGIVEAASFGKYVVNVGDRQKGRAQSDNIINAAFKEEEIIEATQKAIHYGVYEGDNIYYKENVVNTIINVFKGLYENL